MWLHSAPSYKMKLLNSGAVGERIAKLHIDTQTHIFLFLSLSCICLLAFRHKIFKGIGKARHPPFLVPHVIVFNQDNTILCKLFSSRQGRRSGIRRRWFDGRRFGRWWWRSRIVATRLLLWCSVSTAAGITAASAMSATGVSFRRLVLS